MGLKLKGYSGGKKKPHTVPVPQEIKERVLTVTRSYLRKAELLFGFKPFEMPTIRYDLKGTTAGTAHSGKWEINLNSILVIENVDAMIDHTVPHEVAHLVAFKMYGRHIKPHGQEWQDVMRRFAKQPHRCHQYDTTNARVRCKSRFKYNCACTEGVVVGPIIHRRVQQEKSTHYCRVCKHYLRECSFTPV